MGDRPLAARHLFREKPAVLRARWVHLLGLCVVGTLYAHPLGHQAQSSIDSLVAANSRVLELKNGTPQGPAAEFLLTEAAGTQFVSVGEEHNTADIPELMTALFRILHDRYGFRFVALEQDPVSSRWVSRPPVRGKRDAVVDIARRYPHAFTFMADQELTMLAEIGAISRTAANPVWGCDQAFGATHILDRLLAITPSPASRDIVRRLRDMAEDKERIRDLSKYQYMGNEPKSELFAQLRSAAQATGSEADMLVQSLITSDRIYRNYREGAYYENGREREDYMKRRFLDEYRRALAVEKMPPKVLLKFGHWHLFRGLGPNNLPTLGNFVSEFAIANDSRSFHLAIFPNNAPGGYGDLARSRDPAPKLLAATLKTVEWTVVDLRPFRGEFSRLSKELAPDVRESLRRLIFGYDAALFAGGLRRGSYQFNPGVEY